MGKRTGALFGQRKTSKLLSRCLLLLLFLLFYFILLVFVWKKYLLLAVGTVVHWILIFRFEHLPLKYELSFNYYSSTEVHYINFN